MGSTPTKPGEPSPFERARVQPTEGRGSQMSLDDWMRATFPWHVRVQIRAGLMAARLRQHRHKLALGVFVVLALSMSLALWQLFSVLADVRTINT